MRSPALTSPKANSNHALYKVQTIGSFVLLIFNAPMKHESPPICDGHRYACTVKKNTGAKKNIFSMSNIEFLFL